MQSVRSIVITDLDGTLLGHEDYSYEAALPMLQQLAALHIPVILNSSKTFAELKHWSHILSGDQPFILENGSAIVMPENHFLNNYFETIRLVPGYNAHVFGASMHELEAVFRDLSPQAISLIHSSEEVAQTITGLDILSTRAARQRLFSIPLLFKDSFAANAFHKQVQARGLHCYEGGRFLSLQGRCNKGTTMQRLIEAYANHWQTRVKTIVLGDSRNDLDMLELADMAIVIKVGESAKISPKNPSTFYTQQTAPRGWVEGVQHALGLMPMN